MNLTKHWYHIDFQKKEHRHELVRMLRRQKWEFKLPPNRRPPWRICFWADEDQLEEIRRWVDRHPELG